MAVAAVGVQSMGGLGLVGSRVGFLPSFSDAGVLAPPEPEEERDAALRARRDAASAEPSEPDAGLDAAAEEDAHEPPDAFRALSPREIEDLAKDELDAARADIERGDRRSAAAHLERARELDPESSDLEEVEAALAAMP
jgi:hypothetical protein